MAPAPDENTTLRFNGRGKKSDVKVVWEQYRNCSGIANHTFVFEPGEHNDHGDGEAWGTLTFSGRKEMEAAQSQTPHNITSGVDASFHGLTVLHSPKDAVIDICAVHGLNGHAFETWNCRQSNPSKIKRLKNTISYRRGNPRGAPAMWLRDFLATDVQMAQAKPRVMTFGYRSNLKDSSITSTLKDYGKELLRVIQKNRELSNIDKSRPIIFVAYSLGGLVLRMAMPILRRDEREGQEYSRIGLPGCGIVFLGTPHRGSGTAEWSPLLLSLGSEAFGIRLDLVRHMRPFSNEMDENETEWTRGREKLIEICPLKCLVEQSVSKTAGGMMKIVSQASARFGNEAADEVPGTDHHSLCAFSNAGETPYTMALDKIQDVRKAILEKTRNPSGGPRQNARPGRVEIDGFPDILHYGIRGGTRVDPTSKYVASQEFFAFEQAVERSDRGAIIISGAGGVGKTKAIFHVTKAHTNDSFIFLIDATEPLDRKCIALAEDLGAPLLRKLNEYSSLTYEDRKAKWDDMSPQTRATHFYRWLEQEPDGRVLFIVDDVDSSGHFYRGPAGLADGQWPPRKRFICSTRDPSISDSLDNSTLIDISGLSTEQCHELASHLIDNRYSRFNFVHIGSINRLAEAIGGNARAIYLAVGYIAKQLPTRDVKDFTERYEGNDHSLRKDFLNYGMPQSIMATYMESIKRIGCDGEQERIIHILIAVMSIIQYSEPTSAEECFRLITSAPLVDTVSDHSLRRLFTMKDFERGVLYEKLRNVSVMTAENAIRKPWTECSLVHLDREICTLIREIERLLSSNAFDETAGNIIKGCRVARDRVGCHD